MVGHRGIVAIAHGPTGGPRDPTYDAAVPALAPDPTPLRADDVVFNVVWTGTVFSALRSFTTSILDREPVRLRFLANACPPEELAAMEAFRRDRPDAVVEVRVVSDGRMVRHGDCLDAVVRDRDDGELFGLLDPDILATGPFVDDFLSLLDGRAAVTSGAELWSADNVRPPDHIGVPGEFFYDQDGFVFGSPHFSLYRRGPLLETLDRWGVGFSSAGNDIPDATRARLDELGRSFWIYDTAKIVNILLQGDGHALVHREHDHLVHVGGLAHFLAPPQPTTDEQGRVTREWGQEDRWGEWEGQSDRFLVAGQAARILRAAAAGEPPPPPPTGTSPFLLGRLRRLREALATLPAPDPSDARP